MKKSFTRRFSLVLAGVMAFGSAAFAATAQAAPAEQASTGASYGLPEKIEDGAILHCWTWSFNTIKENLPQIAQAGFKALDASYTGETSFTFVGAPDSSSIQPILKFTSSCKAIQTAMQKASGKKCTLTYNTAKDGSGIKLDLSSSTAILNTLAMMISKNATTIYGIYKY